MGTKAPNYPVVGDSEQNVPWGLAWEHQLIFFSDPRQITRGWVFQRWKAAVTKPLQQLNWMFSPSTSSKGCFYYLLSVGIRMEYLPDSSPNKKCKRKKKVCNYLLSAILTYPRIICTILQSLWVKTNFCFGKSHPGWLCCMLWPAPHPKIVKHLN